MVVQKVLASLLAKQNEILATKNLARALSKYNTLRENLAKTNVILDKSFQKDFKGFYRVRRNPEWCNVVFEILERVKPQDSPDFEAILREVYDKTGRIEPSFASKIVATVNPDAPVYDSQVIKMLSLSKITRHRPDPQIRFRNALAAYHQIRDFYDQALPLPAARDLCNAFDVALPEFSQFTPLKKLDILIWQMR